MNTLDYQIGEHHITSCADLLQLALDDLLRVEEAIGNGANLFICMNLWLNYTAAAKCEVCLAGCVLYMTEGRRAPLSDIPVWAYILDELRRGNPVFGFLVKSPPYITKLWYDLKLSEWTAYEAEPGEFKDMLQRRIAFLREHKL